MHRPPASDPNPVAGPAGRGTPGAGRPQAAGSDLAVSDTAPGSLPADLPPGPQPQPRRERLPAEPRSSAAAPADSPPDAPPDIEPGLQPRADTSARAWPADAAVAPVAGAAAQPDAAETTAARWAADPLLKQQVRADQVRMLFDQMWLTTWAAAGFAVVLGVLLGATEDRRRVAVWLAAKLIVIVPRLWHARQYGRCSDPHDGRWYRGFVALLLADALVWSLAGWWLLPLERVDIAAVIAASLVGATALATFTLYSDWRAAMCFVLPVMLPMALAMTQRADRYGAFGAGAILLFTVLLLIETRRSQRNLAELLTLRYTTDRIARERADALQLAQRHSAVKSRFLATMSHELRTPLHGILGLTRQVRERLHDAADARRLQLVERSGSHLLSVINDVLDFSRIEAGRLTIGEETFDLAALVDDVLALSAIAAAEKGLAVRCRMRLARPCPVRGDAGRVRQVLHNLVGNAVKFTDRGQVTVSVWRETGRTPQDASDRVLIAVEDTGPGIPPGEQVRIFDAFHQVDAADTRRHPGTGLGLSIARELARAMGGDLVCTSTPGRGSVFTFSARLPRVRTDEPPAGWAASTEPPLTAPAPLDAPPPDAGAAPAPLTLAGRRVLLAEDNPVNALVAEAMLQQLGCVVETVGDGAAAVARLQPAAGSGPGQAPIDLVLMDCQMPLMDGFEAARRIRAMERAQAAGGLPIRPVPILALTASALPGDRERCLAAGMQGHLAKPFSREALVAALQALLRG